MEEQILAAYEALSHASSRMLNAALERDDQALEHAETECRALIGVLRGAGDTPLHLSQEATRRKMVIIRKILADDAAIRVASQPWLRQLEALIGGAALQRKLQGVYG